MTEPNTIGPSNDGPFNPQPIPSPRADFDEEEQWFRGFLAEYGVLQTLWSTVVSHWDQVDDDNEHSFKISSHVEAFIGVVGALLMVSIANSESSHVPDTVLHTFFAQKDCIAAGSPLPLNVVTSDGTTLTHYKKATPIRPWSLYSPRRKVLAADVSVHGFRAVRFFFRGSHEKRVDGDEAYLNRFEKLCENVDTDELHRARLNFTIHLLSQESRLQQDDTQEEPKCYGRVGAIVQSTGTGKTTLLRHLEDYEWDRWELEQIVPEEVVSTVRELAPAAHGRIQATTLCLRSSAQGWPERDGSVLQFLLHGGESSVSTVERRVVALVAALCTFLADRKAVDPSAKLPGPSLQRKQVLQDIVDEAEKLLLERRSSLCTFALHETQRLMDTVGTETIIVIAFDDTDDLPHELTLALRRACSRALNYASVPRLWLYLAGSSPRTASTAEPGGDLALPKPFSLFTLPPAPTIPRTLEGAFDLSMMAQCGRPLLSALSPSEAESFVMGKLLGDDWQLQLESEDVTRDLNLFKLMQHRIALPLTSDVDGENAWLKHEQVSPLAWLTGTKNQGAQHKIPPEPIISAIAATSMIGNASLWMRALRATYDTLQDHDWLKNRGRVSEIVGQALILLAADRANSRSTNLNEFVAAQGVSVSDFMASLFTPKIRTRLMSSHQPSFKDARTVDLSDQTSSSQPPDTPQGKSNQYASLFKGKINLVQFFDLQEGLCVIDTDRLFKWFQRGIGILSYAGSDDTKLIIPILLPDGVMSCISIHLNNNLLRTRPRDYRVRGPDLTTKGKIQDVPTLFIWIDFDSTGLQGVKAGRYVFETPEKRDPLVFYLCDEVLENLAGIFQPLRDPEVNSVVGDILQHVLAQRGDFLARYLAIHNQKILDPFFGLEED